MGREIYTPEFLAPYLHLSAAEAARQLGVRPPSIRSAARRHGLSFNKDAGREAQSNNMKRRMSDPAVRKETSERMKRRMADPVILQKALSGLKKYHTSPRTNPLVALSKSERKEYDRLTRFKLPLDEKLKAIGRGDLCK